MAKSILARILIKNDVQYFDVVKKEHLNCEFARSEGLYWLVPVVRNGILVNYKPVISSSKPTVDSVNSVRIKDTRTGFTYYVGLIDAGTSQTFNDACNACCDAVTPLAAVTIPTVLEEVAWCTDATSGLQFTSYIAPPLRAGEQYIAYGSKDGVAFTPAYQAQGFASVAAFQTWAAANWAAYGTWTAVGQKVTLTSATGLSGFIKLVRQKYYESNTPTGLVSGHHYTLDATLDGVVLTQIVGAADGALTTLATAANADAVWSTYGKWSVVAGKIRLVSPTVSAATLLATNV